MTARPSVRRAVSKGAAFLGVSQALAIVSNFVSAVVVARFLMPEDYGVVAMSGTITAFVMLFQSLGINAAIVQAKEVTDDDLSALFWVGWLSSGVLALFTLGASPVAGWFFGDKRVQLLVAASTITVVVARGGQIQAALLNRNMQFGRIGVVETATNASMLVFTIAAAVWLRNFWAIWLGTLLSQVVRLVVLWSIISWRPRLRPAFSGVGSYLRFGRDITAFNVLIFFFRNLDNVLVAKLAGPAALGLYSRAYRLMMFPIGNINQPIQKLVFPVLCKYRDDEFRYRRAYLATVGALQFVIVPAVAVAAAASEEFVPFLLGRQWADAAPLFFWLSLAALFEPLNFTSGWLLQSMGRADRLLRWGVFSCTAYISAFIIGILWGVEGVAVAYFSVTIFRTLCFFSYCSKYTHIRVADFYGLLVPIAVGLASAIIYNEIFKGSLPFVLRFALALLCTYVAVALVCRFTRAGKIVWEEGERTLRMALARIRRPADAGINISTEA